MLLMWQIKQITTTTTKKRLEQLKLKKSYKCISVSVTCLEVLIITAERFFLKVKKEKKEKNLRDGKVYGLNQLHALNLM